jgi:tetratricopeptide (TPR) repeat protein
MLRRALLTYAVAFIVVAIVARAAIVAIGLPDWVFPGALIMMALGLPLILFTAYAQYVSHGAASRTPTMTPGGTMAMAPVQGTMAMLAVKASPHVSWTRVTRGGMVAIGVFVLLVGGFMTLRAMGIGPAGSLLASGKLAANDKVLVASFDAPGADTSLGSTIAAAVRTDLAQSRAVRIVTASAVAHALEQMQRPDSAKMDFTTAREIAQRTGAKAIVGGSVVPAGNGFIVTARLVVAESGDELASFSESAKDVGDLISSVDRLTKSLRGKIGESLKEVRDAPRLDQVTTASLGALRSYSAGLHANDVRGDYSAAGQHFKDAIRQDSTFAMAYVQLAYSLQSLGGRPRFAQAETALTTAFRLRDRLPERERYNIEGAYYVNVARDRNKAIPALRRAIELDSSNFDAANTLGVVLSAVRDFNAAESAYTLSLAGDSLNGTTLMNLAVLYADMGRHASFDSVMTLLEARKVPFPTGPQRSLGYWGRRDYVAAEREAKAFVDSAAPTRVFSGQEALMNITGARGRLRESERWMRQSDDARLRARGDSANPHVVAFALAMMDGAVRGDVSRGLATLDAALRDHPPASMSMARDRSFWLGIGYAHLGNPMKARAVLNQFEARLSPADRPTNRVFMLRLRGMIAIAESKSDSAIDYFRQADVGVDGLPIRDCTACTPLLIGQAFDAGRQADSARFYLTKFVESTGTGRPFTDRWFLPNALIRLGELHYENGDAARATEYYGRFVDLWEKADPELQPRVADVRARIDRINRAKR